MTYILACNMNVTVLLLIFFVVLISWGRGFTLILTIFSLTLKVVKAERVTILLFITLYWPATEDNELVPRTS